MDWDEILEGGEEYANLAYFLEQYFEESANPDYDELADLIERHFLNVDD